VTFIDFFAGVGGFTKGMLKAGHKPVGWCEIDKFARMSYEAIHCLDDKETKNLKHMDLKRAKQYMKNRKKGDEWNATDIRNVRPGDLPEADCYCFGFPCQTFSIAGQRRGFEDTRGTLFFEVMRLARERKPKYLFAENVAGLLSHEGGQTFATILCSLWECGYEWQYQICNSKDFGVPQNRERIFIIGHLRGLPRPEVFPISGTNGKVVEPDCELNFLNRPEFGKVKQSNICQTLKARDHKDPVMVIQKTHGNSASVNYGQTGTLQATRLDKVPCIPVLTPDRAEKRQNGRRFKNPGEEMFTLTAQDIHGVAIIQQNQRREVRIKGESGAVNQTMGSNQAPKVIQRARGYNDGGVFEIVPTLSKSSYEHNNHLFDGVTIRKLTPLECWRLQGWDDEDFYKAKSVNSDSQLYKQAGNGVTIDVVEAIGSRLPKGA
jgi:DNA (cytosine-5)-methyltransferase 1